MSPIAGMLVGVGAIRADMHESAEELVVVDEHPHAQRHTGHEHPHNTARTGTTHAASARSIVIHLYESRREGGRRARTCSSHRAGAASLAQRASAVKQMSTAE